MRTKFKLDNSVAHKQYQNHIEAELNRNPKNFWSALNSKKNNRSIPSTMEYNGVDYENNEDICNAFADYFRMSFPRNSTLLQTTMNSTSPFPNQMLSSIRITEEVVLESIRRIKANMTTGPDDIPAFLIRDCQFVLAQPLTQMFKLIIKTSTFPDK